jgi:hypothetical protein
VKRLLAALFVFAPALAYAQSTLPELAGLPELTTPQSDYVEHCSGCHGMQGNSAPAEIPVLRDRVGYFMCTREGREYLIRLPNVAYSAITDDQQLADMMNFVVFGLGGNSAPKFTRPTRRAANKSPNAAPKPPSCSRRRNSIPTPWLFRNTARPASGSPSRS